MEVTSSTISHTELATPSTSTTPPILRLRLQKKKSPKQVVWSDGTVDNEHMNKKKSKCCCIYKKPLAFGESSSEEEEDCEHCFGHPEKRIKSQSKSGQQSTCHHDHGGEHNHDTEVCTPKDPDDTPGNSNNE